MSCPDCGAYDGECDIDPESYRRWFESLPRPAQYEKAFELEQEKLDKERAQAQARWDRGEPTAGDMLEKVFERALFAHLEGETKFKIFG